MFSPTQSGGAKHMCFLERHVSDLPLSRKIQTCVREIGAAAAATSPLPSFFFFWSLAGTVTGPLPKDYTQVGELARL